MSHRILLAEDHPDTREALQALLESHGFAVVAVEDGLAALKALNAEASFCLILLDVVMPVMDGWQFLACSREQRSANDIPVALFTGDRRSAERARQVGLRPLMKPVDLRELMGVIEERCARRH